MKEKVNIVDNGNNISYDFISLFQINDNDILLMTNNEVDINGNTKLICTRVYNNDTLMKIDDNLWANVKNIMKNIITNNNNGYTYLSYNNSVNYQTTDNCLREIGLNENEKNGLINSYNAFKKEDEEIPIPVLQNIEKSEDEVEILYEVPVEDESVPPQVENQEVNVVPNNPVVEETQQFTQTGGVEAPTIESVVAGLNNEQ